MDNEDSANKQGQVDTEKNEVLGGDGGDRVVDVENKKEDVASGDDSQKNKFIKIAIIIVVVFVGLILLVAIIGGLFGNSSDKKTIEEVSTTPTPSISETGIEADMFDEITGGLVTPWAMDFLPNGGIVITERPGRVRLIAEDGRLQYDPLVVLKNVKEVGEGGLLGVAVHPYFSINKYIYLYYTYNVQVNRIRNDTYNRVVRMRLVGDKLQNEEIIIDGIPGAEFHNGGRIKFGPDSYLYVTTGDAQNPELAQDLNSTAGKILRVTDEGKPAPGNPFDNMVYSYGHRNPQGLVWDDFRNLWETEHGRSNPSGYDEINLIKSGKNYGWPEFEGDENGAGFEAPVYQSGAETTWAPAGVAFSGSFLYFGGLKGEALYRAHMDDAKVDAVKEYFKGEFGRIRDVVKGPDGNLYISTSNRDGRGKPGLNDDKILKINIKKL